MEKEKESKPLLKVNRGTLNVGSIDHGGIYGAAQGGEND